MDDELNGGHAELSRNNVSGFRVRKGGIEIDFNNRAVFPSIRQITLELLKTLKDEFPDLFSGIPEYSMTLRDSSKVKTVLESAIALEKYSEIRSVLKSSEPELTLTPPFSKILNAQ